MIWPLAKQGKETCSGRSGGALHRHTAHSTHTTHTQHTAHNRVHCISTQHTTHSTQQTHNTQHAAGCAASAHSGRQDGNPNFQQTAIHRQKILNFFNDFQTFQIHSSYKQSNILENCNPLCQHKLSKFKTFQINFPLAV